MLARPAFKDAAATGIFIFKSESTPDQSFAFLLPITNIARTTSDAIRRRTAAGPLLVFLAWLASGSPVAAQNPVETYNLRVGTQTFAGRYQFTTNTLLVETAHLISDLGSDILKFYQGPDYPRQYRITLSPAITNLLTLARDDPSTRAVLAMPFRHYLMWVYPFGKSWAFDGFSRAEAEVEYREIYDLTTFVLTNFNGSGKTFYFGHWEGDWYLLPKYNTATNPTPTAIRGMIDWLNHRQRAIDDAKRDTPHTNVQVYGYAEVNRVMDALSGDPNINQRMINAVIPAVTNLDLVSWSAYEVQDAPVERLHAALDFIEAKLPPGKAAAIAGPRLWIGEYGWGIPDASLQTERSRDFLHRVFQWKGGPRFVLFWQIYNNEPGRAFWLVDDHNRKLPAFDLHQKFLRDARSAVDAFLQRHGRLPTDPEYARVVLPLLQPTPPARP